MCLRRLIRMSMGRRDWTVAKEARVQVIGIISVKNEKGLR